MEVRSNVIINSGGVGIGTTNSQTFGLINIGTGSINGLLQMNTSNISNLIVNQFQVSNIIIDNTGIIKTSDNLSLIGTQWITTNNNRDIYINSSVGIGIANPIQSNMDIRGSLIIPFGKLGIGTTNPLSNIHIYSVIPNNELEIQFTDGITGINSNVGVYILNDSNNDFRFINYQSNSSLIFGNYSNMNLMTINSNGNIGIGITNLSSGINIGGNLIIPNGRIGIGTTNPQSNLDIWGDVSINGIINMNNSNISNLGFGKTIISSLLSCNILIETSGDIIKTDGTLVNSSQWSNIGSNIYYNLGFVGIGTNNPKNSLDINGDINYTSNLIVNNYQIFNSINNSNNNGISLSSALPYGISFYNDNEIYKLFQVKRPWGIFFAEDFNITTGTIPDVSGNNRGNMTTTGTITKTTAGGNGASAPITYISGGTSATCTFPTGSIPSTFTILGLTRYTGSSKGRILNSDTNINWLHGHHGNMGGIRGVCHYDGWKTSYTTNNNLMDWLCIIGKNSGSTPNNILADGIPVGTATGGNGNSTIYINAGRDMPGEASDWAMSCVMIWDQYLNDFEMTAINRLINNYKTTGIPIKNQIYNYNYFYNFNESSNAYYSFTENNSITFSKNTICDVLIAGAGGNGGYGTLTGGGGAGEVIYYPNYEFTSGTYSLNSNISLTSVTASLSGSGANITGITASNISNFQNDVRNQLSAGSNLSYSSGSYSLNGNISLNSVTGSFNGNGSNITGLTASQIGGFNNAVDARITNIPNSALQNSSVTINGSSVSLGSSITLSDSTIKTFTGSGFVVGNIVALSGSLVLADPSDSIKSNAIGAVSAISGTTITVKLIGEVTATNASSITFIGTPVYVGSNGSVVQYSSLTSGQYATQIGFISDTGKIILQPRVFGQIA